MSAGRRRPRHRTPSRSPTNRSPLWGNKREASPSMDLGGNSSPHYSDDRRDIPPKRSGKRPIYSRTPSPKMKPRESGKLLLS